MTVHCYTSFTFSYLSRALILARTLKAAHPEWKLHALIVDKPPDGLSSQSVSAAFDHVITPEELGFGNLEGWLFKHDIVEACTAVKGRMLEHLLEEGASKVIYFDPDIAIFHSLEAIVSKLNNFSILLTPHQVEPNETELAIGDNEGTSLLYGVFNLGFIGVRNDSTGRSFAAWWHKQLYRACYDDIKNGIFTDQKYCDLVPALFPDVYVERDPGCNVASWNLSRRQLSFTEAGALMANRSPLKFYHFTKIGSAGDMMTDRYASNTAVLEVWEWYRRMVVKHTIPEIPKGYWYYGCFSNGQPIKKAARELFRSRKDLMTAFLDPFVTGENSFYQWLGSEYPELV